MKNFSRKIISLAVAIFSCFALVFCIGFSVKLIDGKSNASASVSDVSYYKSKLSGTDLIFYNVAFAGESIISFDFTPSSMFMHNDILYVFYFENLVGDVEGKTGKAPNSFGTSFTHPSTSCASYVYSGNFKSMDVYAQPLLIGNDDLSLDGWFYIDKDGNKKWLVKIKLANLPLLLQNLMMNQKLRMN